MLLSWGKLVFLKFGILVRAKFLSHADMKQCTGLKLLQKVFLHSVTLDVS